MKTGIIVVIVVAVLGVGAFALSKSSSPAKPTTTASSTTPKTTSTPKTTNQTATANTATATSFTVNANDESADLTTLNVKKGDQITVTFKVDNNEVYHGGLEFRSDVVSSKPIKTGGSDTVTFTADKSFDFTPFWYQSNIQKAYLVHVVVQG